MTRKTSKFVRKRKAQGMVIGGHIVFKPNAWLERISHSRGYSGESFAGETPTDQVADGVMARARMALYRLENGQITKDDAEPHDLLAHSIGIAQIRVHDIAAADPTPAAIATANELIHRLNDGAMTLSRVRERWEKTSKWGLDGPGIVHLRDSLDIYEEILRASTPRQMEDAQMVRLDKLKKQQAKT